MGLRIKTNVASLAVQKDLKQIDQKAGESYKKLASGKRITKSADDAAGLAIASKMGAEIRGNRMAQRNTNSGISLVQIAEGGLEETSNIITRMRELSIQAASDNISDRERGYLDKEYNQLVKEVDRISKTTKFGETELLTGNGEGVLDFQVGAYAGEDYQISFDSSATDATTDGLGITGTSIGNKDDALENLELLDNAIDKVSGFRSTFGAIQSRLQTTSKNLDTVITNTEAAKSVIEDVDVAAETAKLASSSVIKQAGISTLAQANNLPNNALRLIG